VTEFLSLEDGPLRSPLAKRTLYRVMLVEDNEADARLVREAFDEHPFFSFQVVHFQQVDEAVLFLERDVVDVAVLDYQTPASAGLEALSRIIAAAPHLPVVMLTDIEDDATGLQMMQHGAQDYLVKGTADAAMLVRTIRQAIERKGMSDRVRDSEERFTLAAAGSGDGIWDWQIPSDRLFLSARAKLILGLQEDAPDESMEAFIRRIHLDDLGRFRDAIAAHLKGETTDFRQQVRIMDANDRSCWLLVRGLSVIEGPGRVRRMAGSITDLSNLDAYYDNTTGLPNRTLLMDRLAALLKRRADHPGHISAVVLVALSNYSLVCEGSGQAAGDALIAETARAIDRVTRPNDIVGRVGAREIAVVFDRMANADEAILLAGRVAHALLGPINIQGAPDVAAASRMGIVVTVPAHTDPEAVMRDAMAAMMEDPVDPSALFSVFNPEMRQRARDRLRIESRLRQAIKQQAFRLVYQPIVALNSGELRGFETLLRWHDAELGQVPPTLFIPIAEDIGIINEIGSWVLRTACDQIVKWRKAGLLAGRDRFSVAVNVSGRQLDDTSSIDHIMELIAESGVAPKNLTLELTESALFANPDRAREALMAMKLHGVSLAMDDFGTGYSSLSYLGRFPFDKLKIDRSFINTIAAGVASPLLKGILSLTQDLGLHVVAEGVETAEQRDVLAGLGCQDAQGWLFGRPLDPEAAEALLRSAGGHPPRMENTSVPTPSATEAIGIDGVQRRLAVIVAADVVGFGRMKAHDEAGAMHALKDIRIVVDPMIVAYRGRIIGIAEDSYMLEFEKVTDAVSCSIAVQRAVAMRNAEQPEERRMEFRIGINLGDIVVRGYDVSGDGFNIAAGLEALAMPGGVCVSGEIFDEVGPKLGLQFDDLGPQQVKNNTAPIRAYRAQMTTPTAA
jgi:diguanylate cyclase (GGDEF)-like protein